MTWIPEDIYEWVGVQSYRVVAVAVTHRVVRRGRMVRFRLRLAGGVGRT